MSEFIDEFNRAGFDVEQTALLVTTVDELLRLTSELLRRTEDLEERVQRLEEKLDEHRKL